MAKNPKNAQKCPKMAKMCQIGAQNGQVFARGSMGNRVLGTDQSFTEGDPPTPQKWPKK